MDIYWTIIICVAIISLAAIAITWIRQPYDG